MIGNMRRVFVNEAIVEEQKVKRQRMNLIVEAPLRSNVVNFVQSANVERQASGSIRPKNRSTTSRAKRAGRSVCASTLHQLDLISASTSSPRRITVS